MTCSEMSRVNKEMGDRSRI